MDKTIPEYIEVQTGIDPQHAVIWLHGLGADGHDFESIVPELNLPIDTPVRFIFPHAPMRPITINGGMVMRGWYDISGLEMMRHEDSAGIKESAAMIGELIDQEKSRGIASKNIILAGFSQGGAIVLYTGLRYEESLGGIMALSTYLPLADTTASERTDANKSTSIFMAHGLYDPVINLVLAEASRQELDRLGYTIEWHTYPMQHSLAQEEVIAMGNWLRERLKN